jgi:hypothetical protein
LISARDLEDAALEEIERACTLGWKELSQLTPWGDTFEGFTPAGNAVSFERTYLWETEPGGDIRVEINVYEPHAFEEGARLTRSIARNGAT